MSDCVCCTHRLKVIAGSQKVSTEEGGGLERSGGMKRVHIAG